MGIWPIKCEKCRDLVWFNDDHSQICTYCRNEVSKADLDKFLTDLKDGHVRALEGPLLAEQEDPLMEAFKKTISAQSETIELLRAEVARLKGSQVVINPPGSTPTYITAPGCPGAHGPFYGPPYIVTSDSTSGTIDIKGSELIIKSDKK